MAKNFIHGFYPEYKLAECCEDDCYRPVLNFLCVRGTYIYATNAKIAIRANLHDVSNLTDDEIALLDGKLIPSKTFKELQKAETIEVTADGIVVKDLISTITYTAFKEGEASEYGYKFPNVEAVISQHDGKVFRMERVGISTGLLARLAKAMDAKIDHFALNFSGDGQAIVVRHAKSADDTRDVVGIIMPVLVE